MSFLDVNTKEYFPLSVLDSLGRPLPEHFGLVRYHSWGPIEAPAPVPPAAPVPNALHGIPKDDVLGKYAKTDSRIANGLYTIRQSLQRLSYPTGFSRNDGVSVERALELKFRQVYQKDYAEELDPYMWQVYTWTTSEILSRLVFLKLQVEDMFGTPAVARPAAGVPNQNDVGDPYYYSGVDRVTPNLVRPINTRDTWTQATSNEYDPLHNYGIRRLVAEGKGCVGYRYSCCYQSMGSEGCILGYPEKTRGSVPQLYTWFGGFTPDDLTKQYRGLVFMGNEKKCQQIHKRITTLLTSDLVGKIARGAFGELTETDHKSVYRIAELMHEYNKNIAPDRQPQLPKSTAQKDIEEYLREVVRLEKTTEEVTKESELKRKEVELEQALDGIIVRQLFFRPYFPANLPTRLQAYPFNESSVQRLTQLLQKIYQNYEAIERDLNKTIDIVVAEISIKYHLVVLRDWLDDVEVLEEEWSNIILNANIRSEMRKNIFKNLLEDSSFNYAEYEKEVLERIPSGAPAAREYLLELGRLRAEEDLTQILVEANKTKNWRGITPKDVTDLKKKRRDFRLDHLRAALNGLGASNLKWSDVNNANQRENVLNSFDTVFQHIDVVAQDDVKVYARQLKSFVEQQIEGATTISVAGVKEILDNFEKLLSASVNNETQANEMKKLQRSVQFFTDTMRKRTEKQDDLDKLKALFETSKKNAEKLSLDKKSSAFESFFTSLKEFVKEHYSNDNNIEKLAQYIMFKLPPIPNFTYADAYARNVMFIPLQLGETPPHSMGEILDFRTAAIKDDASLRSYMYYEHANDTVSRVFEYHMTQYLAALESPAQADQILKKTKDETEKRLK